VPEFKESRPVRSNQNENVTLFKITFVPKNVLISHKREIYGFVDYSSNIGGFMQTIYFVGYCLTWYYQNQSYWGDAV